LKEMPPNSSLFMVSLFMSNSEIWSKLVASSKGHPASDQGRTGRVPGLDP
jgi:hypothetical protein